MSTDTPTPELELPEPPESDEQRPRQKAVTIGAVCKALHQEFPDISISKIRYLEDQKLLAPRRTQGGYRLYTQSDIARLRTILRLQRDEFPRGSLSRLRVVGCRPASVDPDAAALRPPELLESLAERRNIGLCFPVTLGIPHQHADPSHPVDLLRPRRERPSNRHAAEKRDELAAS